MKPIFRHDCDDCIYLGPFGDNEMQPEDLWVCPVNDTEHTHKPEFIARYGDYGADYGCMGMSTLAHIVDDATEANGHLCVPEHAYKYIVALQRAIKMGVIG